MISSHLAPRLYESKLVSHPALLALSRCCKYLHAVLTPELAKAVLAAAEDPLWFAVKRAHLGLVAKLLEEKWVKATEEMLVYWVVQGGERLIFYAGRHMERVEAETEGKGGEGGGEEGEREEGERKKRGIEAREREDIMREEARELVVLTLLRLGAGRRLGREWQEMMRDRWPGRWGMGHSMLRGVRRLLLERRVRL